MTATRGPCRKLAASHTRSCNPSFTYSHSENETLGSQRVTSHHITGPRERLGWGHLSGQTIQQPKQTEGRYTRRTAPSFLLSGYSRSVLLLFEIQYRVQHEAAYSMTLLGQRLYIEDENLDKRPQSLSSSKGFQPKPVRRHSHSHLSQLAERRHLPSIWRSIRIHPASNL